MANNIKRLISFSTNRTLSLTHETPSVSWFTSAASTVAFSASLTFCSAFSSSPSSHSFLVAALPAFSSSSCRFFSFSSALTSNQRFKKAADVEAASIARREAGGWKPPPPKNSKKEVENEITSVQASMTPEELERWIVKRPIDNVWFTKYYPERVFSLEKIIKMNREANHPSMLDSPDADVMIELGLNMSGLKATKPLKSYSYLTHVPHKSDHSIVEPRDVAVLVKNTDLQAQLNAKGAAYCGGDDLILKLKNGLIVKDSDFDYLIAHMDIVKELSQLRKKFPGQLPSEKDGSLGVNIHEMFDLHQNGYLFKVKANPHDPFVGSTTFSLGKLTHSIEQMRENLDVFIKILRIKRTPNLTLKRGAYIQSAVIKCPPNPEVFKLEFQRLNDFIDSVTSEAIGGDDAQADVNIKDSRD